MSIGGQTRNPTGKCLRIVTHARSASCGPSKCDTGSVCPPMLIEFEAQLEAVRREMGK